MLKSLNIKNYALINELTAEFSTGLNILTGETGAGKSIIIDALSMILGERADSDVVRKGSEKAIVEAVFDIKRNEKLNRLLTENEFDASEELIIRREISSKNQSRCFINDTPATIGILKQVGDLLVDLHGQHEHQSLLRTETHIETLDDFCGLSEPVKSFGMKYAHAKSLLDEKASLLAKKQQLEEKRSLYEFQLNEINAVNPLDHEEEHLERELTILENAEKLSAETTSVYATLYDGEHSVIDLLGDASKHLDILKRIDDSFETAVKEIGSAHSIVEELAAFIRDYRAKIEFRPERLEEIRTRLGQIAMLKKKYGGTLETVLKQKEKAEKELAFADSFDTEIARLEKGFQSGRKECSDAAQKLSRQRQDGAKKLNKKVIQTLAQLGIPNAQFETKISQDEGHEKDKALITIGSKSYECSPEGMDNVEFFISTNIGEFPKPLVKVASGGEVSRIMLSLKMNVVNEEHVPLLIFDEIDVGISGRISQSVGQAMKELSTHHQVIAITHLPQIAGFADTHFVVEKIEAEKRASTRIRKLTKNERVEEVARLMSGEEVTDAGLQSARELIDYSKH